MSGTTLTAKLLLTSPKVLALLSQEARSLLLGSPKGVACPPCELGKRAVKAMQELADRLRAGDPDVLNAFITDIPTSCRYLFDRGSKEFLDIRTGTTAAEMNALASPKFSPADGRAICVYTAIPMVKLVPERSNANLLDLYSIPEKSVAGIDMVISSFFPQSFLDECRTAQDRALTSAACQNCDDSTAERVIRSRLFSYLLYIREPTAVAILKASLPGIRFFFYNGRSFSREFALNPRGTQ